MSALTLESSLELWRLDARCRDEQASLTPLFVMLSTSLIVTACEF